MWLGAVIDVFYASVSRSGPAYDFQKTDLDGFSFPETLSWVFELGSRVISVKDA